MFHIISHTSCLLSPLRNINLLPDNVPLFFPLAKQNKNACPDFIFPLKQALARA
jgi:hypothetical protein